MNSTLLIGYGNPDREDDGVAWHLLRAVGLHLGLPVPDSYQDEFPPNPRLELAFHLQLTPEMAEDLAGYERVCFVDAHTGAIPQPVQMIALQAGFQHSPFTHHLTPQSLLAMCQTLHGKTPQAVLLSIRGYQFEFEQQLSERTATLLPEAVQLVCQWLEA